MTFREFVENLRAQGIQDDDLIDYMDFNGDCTVIADRFVEDEEEGYKPLTHFVVWGK